MLTFNILIISSSKVGILDHSLFKIRQIISQLKTAREKETYGMFLSDLHHGLPRDFVEELRLRNEHLFFGRDQASHAVVTFFFCEQTETNVNITR